MKRDKSFIVFIVLYVFLKKDKV